MGEEGIRASSTPTQGPGQAKGWTSAAVAHSQLALTVISADPALADLQPLLHQQCAHKH